MRDDARRDVGVRASRRFAERNQGSYLAADRVAEADGGGWIEEVIAQYTDMKSAGRFGQHDAETSALIDHAGYPMRAIESLSH